ncbi:hypothetical protein [Streptomyces sp. NPDC059278]|uniref:hypothetical protein n=1 Tax=Streptomyces sp. NPDC059278 TaxID=3346801 RepID=UPI0036C8D422
MTSSAAAPPAALLHVPGPAAGTNGTCPAGRGERFRYWPVNDGRSVICASVARTAPDPDERP